MVAEHPTPKDVQRRRRRRRRTITILVYVLATIALAWYFESQATTTILFVRHAETDATMAEGGDPPLSAPGRARAEILADFLQDLDVLASVDAIYASELRRTQQTAAPLAERLELEINVANHYEVEPFMSQVLRDHKGEIVLIVTHSDAIAPLIAELHGHQSVPEITSDEYDNFYIVTIPWWGKVKTLRLHYGIGWRPPYARVDSIG